MNTGEDRPTPEQKSVSESQGKNDGIVRPEELQLYFSKARGKIFRQLLNMDAGTLWQGLSKIPYDQQIDFISRIPFDSPIKKDLDTAVKTRGKHPLPEKGGKNFETIIYLTDFIEKIEEREQTLESVLFRLNYVDSLPTLPSIARQVMMIASDPESSADDLTNIIKNDPSLTSKLLKIVNSAFYGFPTKIGSVKQAVVLLGTSEIISLSFGLAATKVIDTSKIGHFYSPKALWHHSLCTGLIAQYLCGKFPEYRKMGAFTAGLLHDFGKIFLIENFHESCSKVYSDNINNDIPVFELEEDVFGINHAFIGEYLATNWKLPEPLVQSIAFHHQPGYASNYPEFAAITGLADYLYHKAVATTEMQQNSPVFYTSLSSSHFKILSGLYKTITPGQLQIMTQEVIDLIRNNNEIFSILA